MSFPFYLLLDLPLTTSLPIDATATLLDVVVDVEPIGEDLYVALDASILALAIENGPDVALEAPIDVGF